MKCYRQSIDDEDQLDFMIFYNIFIADNKNGNEIMKSKWNVILICVPAKNYARSKTIFSKLRPRLIWQIFNWKSAKQKETKKEKNR